jgi:hypothetical protein
VHQRPRSRIPGAARWRGGVIWPMRWCSVSRFFGRAAMSSARRTRPAPCPPVSAAQMQTYAMFQHQDYLIRRLFPVMRRLLMRRPLHANTRQVGITIPIRRVSSSFRKVAENDRMIRASASSSLQVSHRRWNEIHSNSRRIRECRVSPRCATLYVLRLNSNKRSRQRSPQEPDC